MHRPTHPASPAAPRRRPVRARARVAAALTTLALTVAGALAASAQEEPPAAPGPCPAAVPVAELTPGMPGLYGLTVSKGDTPERFDVEVLDVLTDGIAPGVPMIVVETSSPAIERAGGIWAGMSGSPVYTADGRWVGAVAYGLASTASPIGGITPATEMAKVLGYNATVPQARLKTTGKFPPALAAKVDKADEGASLAQVRGGYKRLPVDIGVAGLADSRLGKVEAKLGQGANVYRAAGSSGGAAAPGGIALGGNFAAAIAYGDITVGGVGTTTVVCGDQALAFGHPFENVGPSSFSAHTASAVTIQPDGFSPFKLANFGGVAGTVDQDRRAAIRGKLGAGPATIPVTANATDLDTGNSREGVTQITDTRYFHAFAPFAVLGNSDVVTDRIGDGRAQVSWTITGTTAEGPFELTRSNKYAYDKDESTPFDDDITYLAVSELAGQLDALQRTRLADVTFTGLTTSTTVNGTYAADRITKVEQRVGNAWVPVPRGGITARPGQTIRLLATLTPDGGGPVRIRGLNVTVPADASGAAGTITVRGGNELVEPTTIPATFDELLASFREAPRGNEVIATLGLDDGEGGTTTVQTVRKATPEVTDGRFDFALTVS